MKTTATLAFTGLLLLASGRLLAQQTFPIYSGTVPNSQPSAVQETSVTLDNGGVRISNVVQPNLTAFVPPVARPTARRSSFAPAAATPASPSTARATTWPGG